MTDTRDQRRQTSTGPWLTDVELAAELGVSRSLIHKLRCAGMPSLAVGRSRRYDPDECLDWLRHQDAA